MMKKPELMAVELIQKEIIYITVLFAGTASLLFYLTYPIFLGQLYPIGDVALDMLLANRISDEGYLLVGHYSRFEFNHPGPFFIYIYYFSEILFGWLPISREQTWKLGSIFLNTAFLTYSALSFSKYLGLKHKNIFSSLFILVTIGYIGLDIVSLWAPNRLLTPYLAFIVSLLHILRGNFKYLVAASFCTGILVHGYATMPFFTVPLLIIGIALGCFLNDGIRELYSQYKYFAVSFFISLIFIFPIILDYFIQDHSNVSLLFKANAKFASMPKPSKEEMLDIVLNLFLNMRKDLWIIFFLTIIPTIIFVKNLRKEERGSIIIVTTLTTLILTLGIFYYSTTPAPLYDFTMYFFKAFIPLLFSLPLFLAINDIALSGLKFSQYINRHRIVNFGFSTLLVAISVTYIDRAGHQQPNLFIHTISKEIISKANDKNKVILDYSNHDQWPIIAGLILELQSSGVDNCTIWKYMAVLYTSKHVCDFDDSLFLVKIVPSELCDNSCDFISNSIGLKFHNQSLPRKIH